MTSGQHIDYDALALEALRGVVRACLAQVSRTGLLGDHHFYIAFNTQAPGVGMSKRLKEKYPAEMTIVLQHRFWDLAVDDERFEVKLTFDGIPERLVVPFAAVKVFYDPSVPYVLQFEEVEMGHAEAGRRGTRRPQTDSRAGVASNLDTARPYDRSSSEKDRKADADASTSRPAEKGDRRRPHRVDASEGAPDTAPVRRHLQPQQPKASPAAGEGPTAPPAAMPVHQPKPAVAAIAEESAEAKDGADEAGGLTGAKIFDISKFRGNKKS